MAYAEIRDAAVALRRGARSVPVGIMPPTDVDCDVQRQYEDFPYPRRDPADEASRLLRTPLDYLARVNHYAWRGRRDLARPLDALVAGGGTGDAAIFLAEQLRDTGGSVTYVDISAASRAVAEARAAARGLANIAFVTARIEELPHLGLGPFDYVNCAGVLHHLASPDDGLRALVQVLKPYGAVGLMVYARYGREPVHQMRDTLQFMLRDTQDPADRIAGTKRLLEHLPATNGLRRAVDDGFLAGLLRDDHELFDLLLHPRERSYAVLDLYRLVEGAGLRIAGFTGFFDAGGTNKSFYRPDSYIRDPELLARISALPEREQQAFAESLHGGIPLHSVYATRASQPVAVPQDVDLVPGFFVDLDAGVVPALAREGVAVRLRDSQGNALDIVGHPGIAYLVGLMDGRRAVRDIVLAAAAHPAFAAHPKPVGLAAGTFAQLFDMLNRFDWVLLGTAAPAWTARGLVRIEAERV